MKKIVSLVLVLVLALTAIGGTLAYFTDTESATNVFTTGKVDIDLIEVFDKDEAKLLPGDVENNTVQKDVSIKLKDGSEDSYVWYTWSIPAVLDDPDDASNNVVHVNSWGATWDNYAATAKYITTWNEAHPNNQAPAGGFPEEKTWDHTTIKMEKTTKDGIEYNVYTVLYNGKLSAGDVTTSAMRQVYMDSRVDVDENGKYSLNGKEINYDFSKGINIEVNAYAIQADGFETVVEAYNAYQAQ